MNPTKLITDLMLRGWSQAAIGLEIGLAQTSISDLYTGKSKTMKHAPAQELIALHGKVMRRKVK